MHFIQNIISLKNQSTDYKDVYHEKKLIMIQKNIITEHGKLIAIGDENFLYILKFSNDKHLDREVDRLENTTHKSIIIGTNALLEKVEQEITAYLAGSRKEFTIPVNPAGTNFQQKSWKALQTIPYGKTTSYAKQAAIVGCPQGHRAVANANGKNPILIIIPCHRIINSNGKLGGYTAGLDLKEIFLNLEKNNSSNFLI